MRRRSRRSPSGSLAFDSVTKAYRSPRSSTGVLRALDDVDLSVEPGESVGIIGPNGAGKSTALRIAAGVTAPTEGLVRRAGHTVSVIELGAGVHPDLTGRENMELLASISFRSRPTAPTLDRAIAFSGLGAVVDRPTRHLSTGMLARLAFSVAVHAEPSIFLVDEVLSVGDLEYQERCVQRIFELRSSGTTVLLVSHDLTLVGEVCERTVLLVAGSVDLDGPTDSVVGHYLGRPAQVQGSELTIELPRPVVSTGDRLHASITMPAHPDATACRLEYVIPSAIALRAGRGGATVSATATVPATANQRLDVSLASDGMPPGLYELHATAVSARHRDLGTCSAPFSLLGPPGRPAIRLRTAATLDGIELEPNAGSTR